MRMASSMALGKFRLQWLERYNRIVHYEWLGHYLFYSLSELQECATQWQWFYNYERPNIFSHPETGWFIDISMLPNYYTPLGFIGLVMQ